MIKSTNIPTWVFPGATHYNPDTEVAFWQIEPGMVFAHTQGCDGWLQLADACTFLAIASADYDDALPIDYGRNPK